MNRLPEQIIRICIVFFALILIIIGIRVLIIPEDLKERDVFRTSAVKRELANETIYAGSEICLDCHDDVYDTKQNGYHQKLSCEVCHGASGEHSEEPDEVTPEAPRGRKFCVICHTYNPSRPTGFPQINPYAHDPLDPCISCHDPHDPQSTEPPGECVACHANIARTLAVSPHVKLECVTCHSTPTEHKIQPRIVRSEKPVNREFCGKCHSEDSSDNIGAPKINIAEHGKNGEKYMCWQCHYPHLPEVD
jgi:hypothetical protein